MKKTLLLLLLFTATFFAGTTTARAQMPVVTAKLYGSSPFQDSLWGIDTTAFNVISRMGPTLAGFTITGINGMAYDPTTYETYVIMKVSGVTGRVLGTIDLTTGVCTQVGNLGANFSSITFREDGQLLGATGDGATPSETLFLIDKTTAVTTPLYAMGNGADGEIILYNRADDFIYHWSGNGTIVFEKMAATDVTYTPISIPIIGASSGETFGSIYMNPTYMLTSNISSSFNRVGTNGTYSASFGANPDDLRGLVMPPQFLASTATVCQHVDTVYIGAGSLQLFDTVVYHWGDGTFDVVGTTGGSHVYTSPGDFVITIELDNGVVRDTFPTTFMVHVNTTPVVLLSGNTSICSGDSVTLGGSSGGTSQWYMDGVAIGGATTPSYSTNVAGVYNMTKTNLSGCTDSAAVGIVLVDVTNPTVNLGNDTTVCNSITLDAQNTSADYFWSTGDTLQTAVVMLTGTYTVQITDTNGCMSSDTISLVINPTPVFSLGADTAVCESIVLSTGIGGTNLWSDNSSASTLTVLSTGLYSVMVTDGNGCMASDSVAVTINGIPVVAVVGSATNPCFYDGAVSLTGTPAGGSYSGTSVSGNQFDPSIGVGSYAVFYSYTDGNGCFAEDTLTISVDGCAGIEENNPFVLSVYPNPSDGLVYVVIPVDGATIQVTDVFGKVVYTNTSVSSTSTIDLSGNAVGTYFISITTQAGGNSIARVVLTK